MKQAIKYSNNYVGIVDKPMRKGITLFANKSWQKAYDLLHFDNENSEANLFAAFAKLYCAAQLELKTAQKDAEIVLDYTDFEFWAYLKEHNFPRYARRFAYHFLAFLEKEKSNFDNALNYINEALSINSPIDDLDDIPLLELKAEIYLAQKEETLAFFTIQRILNSDPENQTFAAIIKTTEYMDFLKTNNMEKFKKGTNTETAIEALNRYKAFLKLFIVTTENFEMDELEPFFFQEISEEDIQECENRLQFQFPPSYRNFILENGLFRLGEYNDYESKLLEPNVIKNLYDEIHTNYYWNDFLNDFADKKEEVLKDTKHLIPFSYGDEQLGIYFYCFDKRSLNPKTGEMAVYKFSQDDWYDFDALAMCNPETYDTYTNINLQNNFGFDKHISSLVDQQIEYLLDNE